MPIGLALIFIFVPLFVGLAFWIIQSKQQAVTGQRNPFLTIMLLWLMFSFTVVFGLNAFIDISKCVFFFDTPTHYHSDDEG